MKKSTKGALFSGLVFPGLGQIVLKKYLRGTVIIIASLASLSILINGIIKQTLSIMDKIESNPEMIYSLTPDELLKQTSATSNTTILQYATLAIIACWLISIVDAYIAGKKIDSLLAETNKENKTENS